MMLECQVMYVRNGKASSSLVMYENHIGLDPDDK